MNIAQLKKTGTIHDQFEADWLFFGKAFQAGSSFIKEVLYKHPSETDANYQIRLKEAYNFPYSKNIVSIYNYFLTEKPAIRDIDKAISNRRDWKLFNSNCDFYGSDFDAFLNESQKLSGAYGVVGILVDHPPGEYAKDDKMARPYLSLFTPNNILDWEYERDFITGMPRLTYLKLRENTRTYLIWTEDRWERYYLDKNATRIINEANGENRLGEIPFVFLPNVKDTVYPYLGVSDIEDASKVNGAIVRTFSMGNEVMKLAGFPMLLYPYQSENQFLEDDSAEDEIVISEDTVLQFDPDAKNGKPSWLESPVETSINAILSWCDRLTEEMYRAANLAGLHQNRDKAQTKSATYLRYQFQQSNSVLAKKAETMVEAERRINYFFAKWRNIDTDEMEEKSTVQRVKEFSVDALQTELENMITSIETVLSKTFSRKMQKRVAKHTYPDLSNKDMDVIDKEIKESLEKQELAENKTQPDTDLEDAA